MTVIYKLSIYYMANRGIGKTKGNTWPHPLTNVNGIIMCEKRV